MTLAKATPYLSSVIRPIAASFLLSFAACATDSVTRAEHAEVLSSLRALRDENARLEARLERLEGATRPGPIAQAARPASTAPAPGSDKKPVTSADAMPPLAVVKLKPRREAAPKIDTSVVVAEPPETVLQEPAAQQAEDPSDLAFADAQFDAALQLLKTGSGAAGAAQMRQFVADWPRHPKADNALYFAGVAEMGEENWSAASQAFEQVMAQYPAGDAVLESMLKLAECNVRSNHPRQARATWERIVASYPGTPAAAQAQARLTNTSSTTASP